MMSKFHLWIWRACGTVWYLLELTSLSAGWLPRSTNCVSSSNVYCIEPNTQRLEQITPVYVPKQPPVVLYSVHGRNWKPIQGRLCKITTTISCEIEWGRVRGVLQLPHPLHIHKLTLPMSPKARGLAQHGRPPGRLDESDTAGCDFVCAGRSMPLALTDHTTCPGL
jgi:hypothetical protein